MATQISELAAELAEVRADLLEASTELVDKITALEAALGSADDLPVEAQDILEQVKILAQSLADVVQPAPVEEPPVE